MSNKDKSASDLNLLLYFMREAAIDEMEEAYWRMVIIQKLVAEGRLRNEKDVKYFYLSKKIYDGNRVDYTARVAPFSAVEEICYTLTLE